jgi:N-acyl-D-amino-acid deacylase
MLARLSSIVLLTTALWAQAPAFDVLIANGRIIDGTGSPWYRGDIGIRGDTIAAIGRLGNATARQTIDAKGMIVAPGFIDLHSHSRSTILLLPQAENLVRQGVTFILEGPDGSSALPLAPFLEKVAAARPAVNFGSFLGQGTVRDSVVGLINRKATPEELEKMKGIVRQAMQEGSFGLSSGLYYVPGNFTPTEEIVELAKIAGQSGGIYISHMRDEAAGLLDSVRETIRIGEEGGLPTQITHHKVLGRPNWGKSTESLALIEAARARGVDVSLDQYPYTASSTSLAGLFPQWSLEGGQAELIKRMKDPATRLKIRAGIVQVILYDRGGGDPKNVVIANCNHDPSLAGKSLAQITDERRRDPTVENAAETAMDIQAQGQCATVYHGMEEPDLQRILKFPQTMIASDGGIPEFGRGAPHPRNYGTWARVLGRYVRELKLITLEDAVRRMSALPASRLRLPDRGMLWVGMKADVSVFDPDKVIDKATFREPHQYSEGFLHLLVNGQAVMLDGKLTGTRPGRILYGPGKS